MEGTNTLEDNLRGYSEYVCQNLSCHGGNWASKIRSGKLKTFYLIVFLGLQGIVFQYIISSLAKFISGIFYVQIKNVNSLMLKYFDENR